MMPRTLWLTGIPVECRVPKEPNLGILREAKREPDRANESDSLATNPHYRKGA